ncbi:DUF2946 family protein [Tepidimonas aquatica]|nr:DUF2946 family protein [Tepidimonas aquatica]
MNALRRHPRAPLVLAMLALLWATLAPTLARAWVPPAPGQAVQICTSTGMAWVVVDPEPGPVSKASMAAACDWCVLHGGAWLPPTSGGWAHGVLTSASCDDAVQDAAPQPAASAWWRPQPHAPPTARA